MRPPKSRLRSMRSMRSMRSKRSMRGGFISVSQPIYLGHFFDAASKDMSVSLSSW